MATKTLKPRTGNVRNRTGKVRDVRTDAEQLVKATTELPPLDLTFILEHVRQMIDFAVRRRNVAGDPKSEVRPPRDQG